jgi:hypothetical protein
MGLRSALLPIVMYTVYTPQCTGCNLQNVAELNWLEAARQRAGYPGNSLIAGSLARRPCANPYGDFPMKRRPSVLRMICLLALVTPVIAVAPRAHAATNLLKFYLGGSVGRADLRARYPSFIAIPTGVGAGSFSRADTAWQLTGGIRTLEVLGAEVDYFDLGGGAATVAWPGPDTVADARLSQSGEAAFAVFYLPIPLVDVYFKAGMARLRSKASARVTGPGCSPGYACPLFCVTGLPCGVSSHDQALAMTETKFAVGTGVACKLGDWAIRGEYERFTALGEHPSLVSLGVTWSFL